MVSAGSITNKKRMPASYGPTPKLATERHTSPASATSPLSPSAARRKRYRWLSLAAPVLTVPIVARKGGIFSAASDPRKQGKAQSRNAGAQ
jgi:hypothetical protein